MSPIPRPRLLDLVALLLLLGTAGCQTGDAPDEAEAPEVPGGPEAPAAPQAAEAPPGTDIWLAELRTVDGLPAFEGAENVTAREGYDNQPTFLPEDGSAFLYTVIDETGRADIWRYELAAGTATPVTRTAPESEYSATPLPGGGGFSTVRVEADSTQRLWRFDMDGTDPRLVLEGVAPVGYHAWGDETTVALFVLGAPATLHVADTRTGESRMVVEGIGRSMHPVPGRHAVSFTRITEDGESWITEYDLDTGEARPLVRALDDGDFHAWTPEGILLMGSGPTVRAWDEAAGEWREVGRLPAGATVSRLAVSPDGTRIAVVGEGGS